jgi:hypothetical protein
MLEILKSMVDDPQTLAVLLGVGVTLADLVIGKLPDRLIPYVGIIRRVVAAYLARKTAKE